VNILGQKSHFNWGGKWVLRCWERLDGCVKVFVQSLQLKGFVPLMSLFFCKPIEVPGCASPDSITSDKEEDDEETSGTC